MALAAAAAPPADGWLAGCAVRLEDLGAEVRVLLQCLQEVGLVHEEHFLARLHRDHFARVLCRHPLRAAPGGPPPLDQLPDVLAADGAAAALAAFAGPGPLEGLRSAAPSLAAALPRPLVEATAAALTRLYLFGGWDDEQRDLSLLECFAPLAGAWEELQPLHEGRVGALAASTPGHVYICGGWRDRFPTGAVDRFRIADGAWELMSPLRVPRYSAFGGILRGRLYVCGGFNGEATQGVGEVADLSALQEAQGFLSMGAAVGRDWYPWSLMPSMPQGRAHAAWAAGGGHLYVAGGWDGRVAMAQAERWSADRQSWESLPDFPCRLSRACGALFRGCFLVCGGYSNQLAVETVAAFEISSHSWVTLQPMLERRAGAVAAVGGDHLYVFGGWDGQRCMASAERLSPATGQWELLPPLSCPRRSAAAVAAVG